MKLLYIHLLQIIRYWHRHAGKVFFSLAGLACGLVCFTFSAADLWDRTHYDSFREGYKDLYVVETYRPGDGLFEYIDMTCDARIDDLRNRLPEGSRLTACAPWPYYIQHISAAERAEDGVEAYGLQVDSLFAGLMDVRVCSGDVSALYRLPDRLALTDSLAFRLFGTCEAVGRQVVFRQRSHEYKYYTVAAVVRRETHTAVPFDLLLPYRCAQGMTGNTYSSKLYVRTDRPAEVQRHWAQSDSLYNRVSGELAEETLLCPLRSYPLTSRKGGFWQAAFYPLVFVLLSALLLFSAAFNYMALLTSMCIGHLYEYRLRLCLGGGLRDNLRRLLMEVGLAFVCVWFVGAVLLEYVSGVYEPELTLFEYGSGVYVPLTAGRLYGYYFVFSAALLVLLLLMAVYPAVSLSRLYRRSLVPSGRGGGGYAALPGVQMAVSILLIFLLVNGYRQFRLMTRDGIGFSTDRIIEVEPTGNGFGYWRKLVNEEMAEALRHSSPAITDVCLLKTKLVDSDMRMSMRARFVREGAEGEVAFQGLSAEAVNFFGMTVTGLDGRPVRYEGAPDRVLVNRLAAEQLGLTPDDPWITYDKGRRRVEGIVHLRTRLFDSSDVPTVFVPDSTFDSHRQLCLKYRPGCRDEAVAAVERTLERMGMSPDVYSLSPYSDTIVRNYETEQHYLMLFGVLSLLGLFITLFGVLAMVIYELRRSRRAMAVRRVFGAGFRQLCRRYLTAYVVAVVLAALVAVPVGYVLITWWLGIYAERIEVGLWPALLAVGSILLLVVAVVAVSTGVAMRERPAQVLQGE